MGVVKGRGQRAWSKGVVYCYVLRRSNFILYPPLPSYVNASMFAFEQYELLNFMQLPIGLPC